MGPTAVSNLPERLSTVFRFHFDGTRWGHPDGNYKELVLRVIMDVETGGSQEGLPCALWLVSSQDMGQSPHILYIVSAIH